TLHRGPGRRARVAHAPPRVHRAARRERPVELAGLRRELSKRVRRGRHSGRGSLRRLGEDETTESRHGREAAGLSVVNGASRARTGDLLGAIQALSQLSYSPEQATV